MTPETNPKKRSDTSQVNLLKLVEAAVKAAIKALNTPEVHDILRLIFFQAIAAYFAFALLTALATILVVQVILWAISHHLLHIKWESVLAFFQSGWGTLLGTAIIVIAGSMLYILRATRRAIYGILEFCFAVAVCWFSVRNLNLKDFGAWAAILSSAYLVVRGLDNFMEGMKEMTV